MHVARSSGLTLRLQEREVQPERAPEIGAAKVEALADDADLVMDVERLRTREAIRDVSIARELRPLGIVDHNRAPRRFEDAWATRELRRKQEPRRLTVEGQ